MTYTLGEPRRNGRGLGFWFPILLDGSEVALVWSRTRLAPPNIGEYLHMHELAEVAQDAAATMYRIAQVELANMTDEQRDAIGRAESALRQALDRFRSF